MIDGRGIVFGLILPAGVIATAFLLAACSGKSNAGSFLRKHGATLALAGAYLAGHGALFGWPGWLPVEATGWLFHFVILAAIAGVVGNYWAWTASTFRLMVAVLLPWVLLQSIGEYEWETATSVKILLAMTAALLLYASAVGDLAKRAGTTYFLSLFSLICGGTALVLGLSGSVTLAQTSGILAGALLAALAISPWLPQTGLMKGGAGVVVVVSAGLWITGHYYAALTPTNALLLAGSTGMAWLVMRPPLPSLGPWQRKLLGLLATAIPIITAIAKAGWDFYQAQQAAGYGDYY